MAVDHQSVSTHIQRALEAHERIPDFLRRLTKAFRLLQAERRDPVRSTDESLAAAEHYLFARQAIAGNAVSLVQMLTQMAEGDGHADTRQRMSRCAPGPGDTFREHAFSQDVVGWGVAGAVHGEADRMTYLPQSAPPPFKAAFGRDRTIALPVGATADTISAS